MNIDEASVRRAVQGLAPRAPKCGIGPEMKWLQNHCPLLQQPLQSYKQVQSGFFAMYVPKVEYFLPETKRRQ